MGIFIFFITLLSPPLTAVAEETEAYWEYGFGLGAVRYEHYPASNQFSYLVVPAPTFQYRGKILRADERDGAHLYLFKGENVTLEVSGTGFPSLDSSSNDARTGMDNLPWLLALGPQLIYRGLANSVFSLGAYQALSTDFQMTRTVGGIFEARAQRSWEFPLPAWGPFKEHGVITSRISLSLKAATQELQSLYYEVPSDKVNTSRALYEAKAGFLSRDLSYYQSYQSGRASINVGASWNSYENAANQNSPLFKSANNLTAFLTFNYKLGESRKAAVPLEDTSGLINNFRQRYLNPGN